MPKACRTAVKGIVAQSRNRSFLISFEPSFFPLLFRSKIDFPSLARGRPVSHSVHWSKHADHEGLFIVATSADASTRYLAHISEVFRAPDPSQSRPLGDVGCYIADVGWATDNESKHAQPRGHEMACMVTRPTLQVPQLVHNNLTPITHSRCLRSGQTSTLPRPFSFHLKAFLSLYPWPCAALRDHHTLPPPPG